MPCHRLQIYVGRCSENSSIDTCRVLGEKRLEGKQRILTFLYHDYLPKCIPTNNSKLVGKFLWEANLTFCKMPYNVWSEKKYVSVVVQLSYLPYDMIFSSLDQRHATSLNIEHWLTLWGKLLQQWNLHKSLRILTREKVTFHWESEIRVSFLFQSDF